EETLKPYKLQAEKLTKEIDALGKTGNAAAIVQKKGEWDAVNSKILEIIEEKHQKNMPIVWSEVNKGIDAVAKAYGFQIVLGYGDLDDPSVKAFQSVHSTKLRAADMGCTPTVYIHGSVDITPVVIQTLAKN